MSQDPASNTDNTPPQGQSLGHVFMSQVNWSLVILIIFALVILMAILFDAQVLKRLQDAAYARGVITFLVSLAAIALAFMFAYQAFTADKISENGFRRGREVLTGIMGILGTIVGFYFGSADKTATARLDLIAKQDETQLIVHVDGGTPPYRVLVTYEPAGKEAEKFNSEDGWIVIPLTGTGNDLARIKFDVADARDLKVTKTVDIQVRPAAAATSKKPPVTPDPVK